jgi:crotonobetainyl-CoA:carnitine CoA-transferase CaiB-like acyl-CoA transferase
MPRPDDVDMVPAWLEIDSVPNDPWPAMEREVANRPGDEVADRAALLGLACSFVGETTDHRAVLVRDLGDASPRPLEGMIVANLASLWAGPLAADILSRLGARVIKVESTGRPDGSREAPTFFHAMHERSESVAIDLAAATGHRQLRAFLERVDVVIEGSRPRALERMGIVAEQIAQSGPTVWLSITGHGRTGDSGMRVGFGDDGAAAGGLVGWVDREPRFLADAIADPLTGLIAATAVQQLTQRGGRWLVDVALSRVAASMVGTVAAGTSKQKLPSHPPNAPRRRHEGGGPTPLGRDTQALFTEFDVPH